MLSEKEIEKLKSLHGKITTVEIPLDEDDESKKLVFYLKKPTKENRKMISKLASGSIPERAVVAGFKAMHVGGDPVEELEKYDDALLSAEEALIELLTVQKAVIKKN